MNTPNELKKLVVAAAAAVLCAQANAVENADARAAKAVAALTPDEKIKLVFGYFSTDFNGTRKPDQGIEGAAGFVYGIERLGIPAQQITDAGIGGKPLGMGEDFKTIGAGNGDQGDAGGVRHPHRERRGGGDGDYHRRAEAGGLLHHFDRDAAGQ